ncbi:MAG TPA: hypothetical protein VMV29_22695 [Ktedonobacterales bacterium]|nr:hypothetical protein [Ktedonobacterales bacterium]
MPFGRRSANGGAAGPDAELAALGASAHQAIERGYFADALAMTSRAIRKGANATDVWAAYA